MLGALELLAELGLTKGKITGDSGFTQFRKDGESVGALGLVGDDDEDIAGASAAVEGKTEQDALIAYLQGLGLAVKRGQ